MSAAEAGRQASGRGPGAPAARPAAEHLALEQQDRRSGRRQPDPGDVLEHRTSGACEQTRYEVDDVRLGPGPRGPGPAAARVRGQRRRMLTYITRRVLYSIPVILIASFLAVRVGARDVRSVRQLGARRARRRVARVPGIARPRRPGLVQYGAWLERRGRTATSGRATRTNDDGHERCSAGDLVHRAADLLGHPRLGDRWRSRSGVYSAVTAVLDRRLHVHRRSSFIGLAMPPFWFGLIAIEFFAVGPKDWFDLEQPVFYFVGLHSGGSDRLRLGLRAAPRAAGADADRADHRRVEPVPARVDARRAVRRLHPHRAGEGRPAAQGDLQARRCATR